MDEEEKGRGEGSEVYLEYVLCVQCRLCWHVLCNALLMPLIELKYFIMKESSLTSIMYTTWKA